MSSSKVLLDKSFHSDTRESMHDETPAWWERLDPELYTQSESFQLNLKERLKVGVSSLPDRAVRRFGSLAVGLLAFPTGYHPRRIQHAIEDAAYYRPAPLGGNPDLFFRPPPSDVKITRHRPLPPYFRPKKGRCWDLRFESPYQPLNPRLRDNYLGYRNNRTSHARYWKHNDRPRPTLAVIHGFSADPYWLNEWFFELPRFYRQGYNILLYTLPFHGRRKERWAPFSGHGFFASGINHLNEAFGQAIMDFRIFLDFLMKEEGTSQVGVTGISLGAYTAALLAAVEERLAFSIPNVPVTSIPDLVMEWNPIGTSVRMLMRVLGSNLSELRQLLAVHCPLSYAPRISRDRLMVIGAVGDCMAPPKHARLLWEHWGSPRMHWLTGSHLVHLDRKTYQREIFRFLDQIGF